MGIYFTPNIEADVLQCITGQLVHLHGSTLNIVRAAPFYNAGRELGALPATEILLHFHPQPTISQIFMQDFSVQNIPAQNLVFARPMKRPTAG